MRSEVSKTLEDSRGPAEPKL
jgi:hypothetical protein